MDNDIVLAMPTDGEPDPDLLRAFLVHRIIYVLEPDENPSDFVALVEGALPLALGYQEKIYWLDPDDLTASPDEITIVTSDGYIYKANIDSFRVRSVIARDVTTPPETGVEIGDTWIVPAGAADEWADFEKYKARWSLRGWLMIAPYMGDWLYVEDEDSFVRFTEGGEWEVGPGGRAFDDNSVPLSAAINFGRFVIVENQTTNAPPGSAAVSVAYIIGPSPTGAWAGQSGKVAIAEQENIFTIYTAPTGMRAFDKAQNKDFQKRASGLWESATGATRINLVNITGSLTYSKPAGLVGAKVTLIAGGQGGGTTNPAGEATSFGALFSTTTGGMVSFTGTPGLSVPSGEFFRPGGRAGISFGASGEGGTATAAFAISGTGGTASQKYLAAADIPTNVSVTIGAGGAAGSSGTVGIAGRCVIEEYIEI